MVRVTVVEDGEYVPVDFAAGAAVELVDGALVVLRSSTEALAVFAPGYWAGARIEVRA